MIRSGNIPPAHMPHPASTTALERIVIAASAAIACLLVGFWIWMASTARDDRLDDTKIKVENLAATMVTHAQRSIQAADLLLMDIVERVGHDGFGGEIENTGGRAYRALRHHLRDSWIGLTGSRRR